MPRLKKDALYNDVKSILEQARTTTYRAVNFTMVMAYWQIGKRIVEQEQSGKYKANYGDNVINELADKLTADFGKGYTATNLKYFRQFFITFSSNTISHAVRDQLPAKQKSHAVRDQLKTPLLRSELSWTHYR